MRMAPEGIPGQQVLRVSRVLPEQPEQQVLKASRESLGLPDQRVLKASRVLPEQPDQRVLRVSRVRPAPLAHKVNVATRGPEEIRGQKDLPVHRDHRGNPET